MKRSLYRKQREAAVLLQSAVRCMQQRNRFLQVSTVHPWQATKIRQDQPSPFTGYHSRQISCACILHGNRKQA